MFERVTRAYHLRYQLVDRTGKMPGDVPPKAKQEEPTVASWKGAGTLQRRKNGNLRVRVKVSGRTRSKTFKAGTKLAKIKQVAADLERDLREEIESGGLKRMKFSKLLEQFETLGMAGVSRQTVRAYGDSLKPLRLYFVDGYRNGYRAAVPERDPWVHEVDEAAVLSYMAWRSTHVLSGEGLPRKGSTANRTVNKDRAVLHKALELAGKLSARSGDNPAAKANKFKEPDFMPTILSPTQVDRLIESCRQSRQPMLYPFAVVLADSAVRSEKEALHLKWRFVNLESRVLVIKGKGDRVRVVPMSRRVHRVLTEHAEKYRKAVYNGKRTEWVFHHTANRRHHRAGTRIKSMRAAFKNAAARAGIQEELRQHDMRHSAATNWLAAGASQKKVQDILGHTNPKMTDRYTHLIAEHLRDVVDLNAGDGESEETQGTT